MFDLPVLPNRWTVATCLALACAMAQAQVPDTAPGEWRVSGYGTAGLTWDDRKDMAPTRDISQRPRDVTDDRAGFASAPTWRLDSRLGLQVDYRLSDRLELVAQAVLRDHEAATLANSIEATYVGWRPLPDLDVRAGRLSYDAFLMSDTRSLGYAYPWVRPPTEFYSWIPIFSVDGADIAYRFGGDDKWRIKAQFGRGGFTVPLGTSQYKFVSRELVTLTLSHQAGPWRYKAGYSQFEVGTEADAINPLRAGLGQLVGATAQLAPSISQEANDLERNLRFRDARIRYLTLGLHYDDGTWLGQAEWGHASSTSGIIPHGTMWYAGLGRRFGDWTPFVVASSVQPADGVRTPSANWSVIGQADLQRTALSVINSTRAAQDTMALGVRWDVGNQVAVKVQWSSTRVQAAGYGQWWRDLVLNARPARVNLLSVNADFIF